MPPSSRCCGAPCRRNPGNDAREESLGIGDPGECSDAITEIDSDESRDDDAEGEHPLEDAGSLTSRRCGEALGEIEGNDDADEAAAHSLQEPTEEQRSVSVREGDDRDADDEGGSAEDHERLASHPIGEYSGEERGEDGAQKHGRDDNGELRGIELGCGFEVGERAADDADIESVEQATEARNQLQDEVVTPTVLI